MVTIGDLCANRSGIPTQAGDDLEAIGFTREQIIDKLRLFPLNPFRVSSGYSNFGMTTGGEAVAAAVGMSWEDLSAKELYEPLGMPSTSSAPRRNRMPAAGSTGTGSASRSFWVRKRWCVWWTASGPMRVSVLITRSSTAR